MLKALGFFSGSCLHGNHHILVYVLVFIYQFMYSHICILLMIIFPFHLAELKLIVALIVVLYGLIEFISRIFARGYIIYIARSPSPCLLSAHEYAQGRVLW